MLRSLSIPGVRRLAALYATADLLEWFGSIALMLLVYENTGSALGAGAMLVCKQIVPGLLATAAGRLLDRYPSERIVGVGFLLQAAAVLAIGSLGYGPALYALAIGSGLGGTLTRASFRTTIAKSLAGDERRLTTALINATMGTISLLGPAIAAGLATATSPQDVLLGAGVAGLALGAFTLLGPATTLGDGSMVEPTQQDGGLDTEPAPPVPVAAAASTPLLLPLPVLFAITAAITTGFAMDEPSLLPYSEQSLGAGAGGYGAILSFWGVGIVVGSFSFGRIMGRSMLSE
ncbi:MAG: MFS transporter, partial [Solirubrobacteraceae bacterium]|nr:MFS transporter [Solirubrobacteraceae bacterium]